MDEMDRRSVEGPEGGGVHELGKDRNRRDRDEGADQKPSHERDRQTPDQNMTRTETLEQVAHHQKHQHLGHDAERPKRADRRGRVSHRREMNRVKGVIDPVTRLHEKAGGEERHDLGSGQEHAQSGRSLITRDGRTVRDGEGREPNADEEDQHPDRYHAHRRRLQLHAQDRHHQDKPDRAPQPNQGIAGGPMSQMIEGHRLHLRKGCVPEEAEQDHRHGDGPEIVGRKDAEEGHRRDQRGEAHDRHAPTRDVDDMTPEHRCDDLGADQDRHELTDRQGVEPFRLQIRPPKGHQCTERREIEEVVAGESPVRHRLWPGAEPRPL